MFTNPKANLHIDLLKSQYAVFSLVLKRISKDEARIQERKDLQYELNMLELYFVNNNIEYNKIKQEYNEQSTDVVS